jgi:hypothetical protein
MGEDSEGLEGSGNRSSDIPSAARVVVRPPPPPPAEASSDLPSKVPSAARSLDTRSAGGSMSGFGIEEAVLLVRQLPTRNTELVMQVVKKTLESVRVDVVQIIEGATKKEHVIEDRITTLKKEIEKLEAQIAAAKKEIGQLEAEQREVTGVKERLVQAQKQEAETSNDRPIEPSHPRGAPSLKPTASVVPQAPARPGEPQAAAKTPADSPPAPTAHPTTPPTPSANPKS